MKIFIYLFENLRVLFKKFLLMSRKDTIKIINQRFNINLNYVNQLEVLKLKPKGRICIYSKMQIYS